jgi:hypothetical protein
VESPPPNPTPVAAATATEPAAQAEAPVQIANAPPNLRVTVDGVPAQLPVKLARRPGQYHLRFESPGRQPQTIDVDGMAPSHAVRLQMARRVDRADPAERVTNGWTQLPPPASGDREPTPTPPGREARAPEATPARGPALIEDVDDAPAPAERAKAPAVPLIEEP